MPLQPDLRGLKQPGSLLRHHGGCQDGHQYERLGGHHVEQYSPAFAASPNSASPMTPIADRVNTHCLTAIVTKRAPAPTALTADRPLMVAIHRGGASGSSTFCHFMNAVISSRMPRTSSRVETMSLWPLSEDACIAAPKTSPNRRPWTRRMARPPATKPRVLTSPLLLWSKINTATI
jgi:hypothetical protein